MKLTGYDGCALYVRGYHRFSKAWYALDRECVQVMFGIYGINEGTKGEMSMNWEMISDKLVPRLKVYCDALEVLASFKDVIDYLGKFNNYDFTEEEFCTYLDDCGFIDITSYDMDIPRDIEYENQTNTWFKKQRETKLKRILGNE